MYALHVYLTAIPAPRNYFTQQVMPYMYTSYMYALYVCLICLPYMYALYVCLICMPYMYTSLLFMRHATISRNRCHPTPSNQTAKKKKLTPNPNP